jgi:plasmid stabilization system protein ParE
MPKVNVSPSARKDLVSIHGYILNELDNAEAATRILGLLRKGIESLQSMPERGKPLDSVLSVHTEYRFLIMEQYKIFYLYDGEIVEIIRILHSLQDYMRALFG